MHLDDGSRLDAVRTCYHHSISTNTKLTVVCAYEQCQPSSVLSAISLFQLNAWMFHAPHRSLPPVVLMNNHISNNTKCDDVSKVDQLLNSVKQT